MNNDNKFSTIALHVELIVLFVTLIGGFFALKSKIETQGFRIDQQGQRTDKLYEMFVDLLKEKHNAT